MDSQKMLEIGIDVLKCLDTENIVSVDIDRTEHNDGTATTSVSVTAAAVSIEEDFSITGGNIYLNGEELSKVLLKDNIDNIQGGELKK